MLETLKETGRNIGRELGRTWGNLSDGWRELLSRSSNALTHFVRSKNDELAMNDEIATFPRWSLLAGEVEETGKEILVRIELPGMDKEDCHISIEGNMLYVSGEKRYERETHDSTYHLMERAYGSFQRAIPLPRNVDTDKAEAHYKNGVLTVRLPKVDGEKSRAIQVS